MSIWKTDKVTSLAALEDFQIFYFDEANKIQTTTSPNGNIIASFENFAPGDIFNEGEVAWIDTVTDDDPESETFGDWVSGYNPAEELSATNHPYNFYIDDNRLTFRFYTSLLGNIVGENFLIKLTRMDSVGSGLPSGEYRVFNSIAATSTRRDVTYGTVWLCNKNDDSEFGIAEDVLDYYETNQLQEPYKWEYTVEAWNDAKVTINDADFWIIDPISSQ